MSFSNLNLSKELLQAIQEKGYTTPSPIQKQAIPIILSKKDILAGAQTGTGKTASFTLPLLQLIMEQKQSQKSRPHVRALILTPTRELASQVAQSVKTYGKYLPLKSTVIFGGIGINPQKFALRKGVDIVIATPGRLLDHVNQNTIDLSQVDFLVLDEADKMLDMGFIHDIKKISSTLQKNKQSLLFFATFSNAIKKLADGLLNHPTLIEVAHRNTSSQQIKQTIHFVNKDKKKELLMHLIQEGSWEQVLVFTRTKHIADKLSDYFKNQGINATTIHGNKSQRERTRALRDFKTGNAQILVATDVAARGIDIQQLPHVVNYELPNVAEDYVHRIGRTGRAGCKGVATSLVCGEEIGYLEDIEKLTKKEIEKVDIENFTSTQRKVAQPNKRQGRQRRNTWSTRNPRNQSRKTQTH